MKKNLVLIILIISITVYLLTLYFCKEVKLSDSFIILFVPSLLVAISSSIFEKLNKKKKKVEFKIEKIRLKDKK